MTMSQPLDQLHFALISSIDIVKGGRKVRMDPETFIGEIAFLLARPATASVTLGRGCYYFAWSSDDLQKAMAAQPALGSALSVAMNWNLAIKVAKSEVSGRLMEEAVLAG